MEIGQRLQLEDQIINMEVQLVVARLAPQEQKKQVKRAIIGNPPETNSFQLVMMNSLQIMDMIS